MVVSKQACMNVQIDGHHVTARCGFETVRASQGSSFTTGRWYYEIAVASAECCVQIGFVVDGFQASASNGVGDDPHSWAYDGNRQYRWHDGEDGWGELWEVGDIIGSMVDFDEGTISFSRNGRWLGTAFTLDSQHARAVMYPAATMNKGVWQFLLGVGEVVHAPAGVHLFTRSVGGGDGQVALQVNGCGQLTVDAQHDENTLLQMVMTRAPPAYHPSCIAAPVPGCGSGWGVEGEGMMVVLWIMLGAAGSLGLLTLAAMIHGQQVRRRRQFQLVTLNQQLELDTEALNAVLTTDDSRTKFAEKHAALQQMLQEFGRRGFVDINCTRATLPRDVYIAFRDKAELRDSSELRSRGIRVRFLGEMGIDEGGAHNGLRAASRQCAARHHKSVRDSDCAIWCSVLAILIRAAPRVLRGVLPPAGRPGGRAILRLAGFVRIHGVAAVGLAVGRCRSAGAAIAGRPSQYRQRQKPAARRWSDQQQHPAGAAGSGRRRQRGGVSGTAREAQPQL